MDTPLQDALNLVRGLVAARDAVERALQDAITDCRSIGVDATALAHALNVHRSTLYRRYLPPASASGTSETTGHFRSTLS
jgi:hypothetical protein